ncbi:MAG: TetR/AcrR family transcriptional regulator [Bacteroidales bacterium]|nr:TetR/AcrR family transcriptional regulator [Bacteroidales bacterium]MBN2820002.1 TetR/AcrR family transcriptional regulator [Bacteroidales bacterium]
MNREQDNPKYQDIVRTAHKLFWKHGVTRVSIEEICRESKVSKMTYYKFFSNKKELAITVIDDMFDDMQAQYEKIMNADIPFEEKIKRQLLAKFEGTKEISKELISDIYANSHLGLHEHWEAKANQMTKRVVDDYKKAQKEGLIRQDVNLGFIMHFNAKMAEMIYDSNLSSMYNSTQDLIMEIANLFFYGILTRENKNGD